MHFFGHQVLVFNLPQRDQSLKQTIKIKKIQPGCYCSKSRQQELYLSLTSFQGYIQRRVLASVDLDTGEKRTGDFYELLCL